MLPQPLSPDQATNMTPEQIKAYNDAGVMPITALCGGFPAYGNMTVLTIPIKATGSIKIGADCRPQVDVNLNGGAVP